MNTNMNFQDAQNLLSNRINVDIDSDSDILFTEDIPNQSSYKKKTDKINTPEETTDFIQKIQ